MKYFSKSKAALGRGSLVVGVLGAAVLLCLALLATASPAGAGDLLVPAGQTLTATNMPSPTPTSTLTPTPTPTPQPGSGCHPLPGDLALPQGLVAGSLLDIELCAIHLGASDAGWTRFTVQLPPGVAPLSVEPGTFEFDPATGRLVVTIENVPGGGRACVRVRLQVTATGASGPISFQLEPCALVLQPSLARVQFSLPATGEPVDRSWIIAVVGLALMGIATAGLVVLAVVWRTRRS
jgi:hypothetical protein